MEKGGDRRRLRRIRVIGEVIFSLVASRNAASAPARRTCSPVLQGKLPILCRFESRIAETAFDFSPGPRGDEDSLLLPLTFLVTIHPF